MGRTAARVRAPCPSLWAAAVTSLSAPCAACAVLALALVTSCAESEVLEAPPAAPTSSSAASDDAGSGTSVLAGLTKAYKSRSGTFTLTAPSTGTTEDAPSSEGGAPSSSASRTGGQLWRLAVVSVGVTGDDKVFMDAACVSATDRLRKDGLSPKRVDGQKVTLAGESVEGYRLDLTSSGMKMSSWLFGAAKGTKTYLLMVTIPGVPEKALPTRDGLLKGWKWTS